MIVGKIAFVMKYGTVAKVWCYAKMKIRACLGVLKFRHSKGVGFVLRRCPRRETLMSYRIASWTMVILYTGFLSVFADGGLSSVSDKERKDYLHKAKVWHQTDIPNTNILAGAESEIAVPFNEQVTCQYVEPQVQPSGYAPKFRCRFSNGGQNVHVKYDTREVYGEVAGTRLLWALGFFTDKNYAVKLRCLGCPGKNPFHPSPQEARVDRTLDNALIEEDFPGEIAQFHDQGWAWKELNDVDEKSGGSGKA